MRQRWARLVLHLKGQTPTGHFPRHVGWWMLECVFLVLDVLCVPDLLMLTDRLVKPRQRALTLREMALSRTVFGNHLDYHRVRLDSRAHLGPRAFGFAYVGFQVVKSWGDLSDPVLIHELVHVWQYKCFGSVYIPRALWAQHFGGGYDYGGEAALLRVYERGGGLLDFNYEQMGEVVADYFRLLHGYRPLYCRADAGLLPVMKAVVDRGLGFGRH
jgi:hypothetical protein